jgi:hypothetical protein
MRQGNTKASAGANMTVETSNEFKIKEFVLDQFKAGLGRKQVEQKVLEFFKEYDETKEP